VNPCAPRILQKKSSNDKHNLTRLHFSPTGQSNQEPAFRFCIGMTADEFVFSLINDPKAAYPASQVDLGRICLRLCL
jgi:hypothetical protein